LAALTGLLGLSTALGAFVAGILIGSSKETQWIYAHLAPFRVVFVGAFFVSVGMLINLRFLMEEWQATLALLAAVFVTNTFINAVVLRFLGDSWRDCFYAAALLAQVGELSFVLAAVGYQAEIIGEYAYQLSIITIALSLTLGPVWITAIKQLSGHASPRLQEPDARDASASGGGHAP
jgi:CPA2 family monovalent cation:H+ antiporter-2